MSDHLDVYPFLKDSDNGLRRHEIILLATIVHYCFLSYALRRNYIKRFDAILFAIVSPNCEVVCECWFPFCFITKFDDALLQMVVVLKKLTYGALLPLSEASEEFREGVIKCFRALLLSLLPCSDKSCSCKQILGLPTLLESGSVEISLHTSSKYYSESQECMLAFLQSQPASAAVGHWLSLLLQVHQFIYFSFPTVDSFWSTSFCLSFSNSNMFLCKAAETEVARGHRGSAKLRIEAFTTLRVLVAKVILSLSVPNSFGF